mmetsp:Transcript_17921/g.44314  ORF Transcript_17921/g.44314 Transcript_17921/m.44314 type:complete len:934 (-) Transcript_17921:3-2804(-)
MATQDTLQGGIDVTNVASYPDYESDTKTFSDFLNEHTILRVVKDEEMEDIDDDSSDSDNDNDSDDEQANNNRRQRQQRRRQDRPPRLFEPVAEENLNVERVPCYPPLLQKIKNRDYDDDHQATFLLEVPLRELVQWDSVRGADLADRATANTMRYQTLFCEVIDRHLDSLQSSAQGEVRNRNGFLRDTEDVLHEQRMEQQTRQQEFLQQQQDPNNNIDQQMGGVAEEQATAAANNNQDQATTMFPPILLRKYELRILPLTRKGKLFPFVGQYISKTLREPLAASAGVSLRHVRAKSLGRLVTITGMVVRASDVKPYCQVATYSCDDCGAELYQVLHGQREFMPQRHCPNCAQQNRRQAHNKFNTLHLQTRGSKFVKFQELKLQELPTQVPMGHVPRSLSVFCRGELTRLANPGDVITVDGVFLPQKVTEGGYRSARNAGLMATLFLEAQHVELHKKSFDESLMDQLSETESEQLDRDIQMVATSEDPIGILGASIAPEIFGHENIKRALLLQLTGGVTRLVAEDGMKIRGDINICLMGDPGVAKSQLLKHVSSIAPRGVYTTGKGSSGVGLTAAVTKNTMTGELSLEGGALVLADRGICAIDEFDKMDETDRTAIHEVMEQQTVSIAKAGIVATLNARTAVLAAANPLYSRYNRNKSLSENINLPNSLLSRFDLMFLILDTPDVDKDMALARHVTFVHQNEGLEEKKDDDDEDDDDDKSDDDDSMEDVVTSDYDEAKGTVTPRLLREYVARARRHEPTVPREVAPYIVEAYVSLRMQDRPRRGNHQSRTSGFGTNSNGGKAGDQTAMTARQLLSILRLSQALARLRFSDFVAREDVDEAIRLTHMSKASLEDEGMDGGLKGGKKREDVMSRVFHIIRDYATTSNSTSVELKLAEAMVLRKGFTVQQLQSCLEEYEALEIIQVNSARTQIHFVS